MIKQALDQYAAALDRQFNYDRRKTVGASEIGLCARKVAWTKREGKKDAEFLQGWGAHLRGTVMEGCFWEPALKMKYGDDLLWSGKDQRTLESGPLSATPDGLVCNLPPGHLAHLGIDDIEGNCVLVECKTIDPRINLSRERDANHFQVQVQMGLVRRLTEHKPNYALISYVDASFWDSVSEFPVRYDDGLYEVAEKRAEEILTKDPTELKPEGWIAGGGECEYCPFTKPCGVIRRSVPEREAAADPQFVAEISDMCRDALDAKSEVEQSDMEYRELQQRIKDRLREKSVRRIPGIVVWSPQKGRTNYDMPAIREAAAAVGLDVEKYSTAGEPTDRLQILLGRRTGE